jgi:anti-sigma B factor antagonist
MVTAARRDHQQHRRKAMDVATARVTDNGRETVLHIAGDLDMLGAPVLSDCVAEILRRNPPTLIVDLNEVDFLGSAGLAALIDARHRAATRTDLRIVVANRTILRAMEVTGLLAQFSIYPDLDAARRDGVAPGGVSAVD